MHYRPSLLLSAAVVSLLLLSSAAASCLCCSSLLLPAAVTLVAAVFLDAAGTPALWGSCSSPHCCVRQPVSLGPLSGFARRLQSPVETGTPARRRSEGARFLNRLDAARRLHSQMPLFRQSRMPSWDQICRFLSRMPFFKPLGLSCKPGKLLICNYLIINIIAKCGLPGEAKLVSPGRL